VNKEWKRLYEEAMSVLNPHDVSNFMHWEHFPKKGDFIIIVLFRKE